MISFRVNYLRSFDKRYDREFTNVDLNEHLSDSEDEKASKSDLQLEMYTFEKQKLIQILK